ncbi:hypothetical protein [Pantoea sp. B65]|uniref:hypothetical protein n=1 Tax=Pantoea sp. B65 TaxID=2813359 RepID=UPI0039B45B67
MNKQIVLLVEALEQAAAEDNWSLVQQIDSRISAALIQLRARQANDGAHLSLEQLQQRHAQVAFLCRRRVDELRNILRQHQDNKEGIQAYAQFSSEKEI